jgi:hypothetical protein
MLRRFGLTQFVSKWFRFLKQHWYIAAPAGLGFFVHLTTAILRIRTFFPYPKLLDFSGFYAAALALRSGLSPYDLPSDWLQSIQITKSIPFRPPSIYNPPLWPWLLQPFTFVSFPVAAWLWLFLNLALLAWSALMLIRLAGYHGKRAMAIALILALTFGPAFLDLTLGQTSILLLASVLFIGYRLHRTTKTHLWQTGFVMGLATSAKFFPLTWLGGGILLRRWRFVILGTLITAGFLVLGVALMPDANMDYWLHFLPQRITSASEQASMDDQSLSAWLDRIGRPHTYSVPGLNVSEQVLVTWSPPWSFDPRFLRWTGYALAGVLALPVIVLLLQTTSAQAQVEGGIYLWVLYTLAIFPHIERYNHTLLLPAMAWLWRRGEWQKTTAAFAYLLVGLSRLNHFWIITLPTPWASLASGFGLYATVLLGVSLYVSLRSYVPEPQV